MKRKPYRFFLYLLLRLLHVIILILPYRLAVFLGNFFGGLAYHVLLKYRKIALENLRGAFRGEKSEKELRRIAKGVFRNLGMTGAECLSLHKFNRESVKRLMVEDDFRPIKDVLSKGKGVIIIASHFGNWEMSSICGANFGLDATIIGKRIYYPPYNKFLASIREDKGVKILYRDDKNILRKSLAVLKANNVLGIVVDQDIDSVDGVFVDFFGRPTYTPTGAATMAMLSGAPLLPTFTVREKGKIRLLVDRPIYFEKTGDRKKDILDCTQKCSDVVERYIRMYPSLWAWLHKRWKTRPDKAK